MSHSTAGMSHSTAGMSHSTAGMTRRSVAGRAALCAAAQAAGFTSTAAPRNMAPPKRIVGHIRVPGVIDSIHIAARAGEPMCSVASATLIAGAGIRGDRNYDDTAVHDQQVTLIDAADIDRFNRETGLSIDYGAPRRNVVTRGVALNGLVGKRFRVGQTTLFGVELCEPCATLGKRLARADVTPAQVVATFAHRAGLRARIATGGVIRTGDRVVDVAQ